MTQDELLQALTVERYQPRHLTRAGDPMPAPLSFDDFVASLREEAKRPVIAYAKPTVELMRWQNEEADKFVARRIQREKELEAVREDEARRRAKKKKAPRLDEFGRVEVALASGKSLHDALSELITHRRNK